MSKRYIGAAALLLLFAGLGIGLAVAEGDLTREYDVNHDGTADVTYFSDGEYVTKVEADTNYDGVPDVTVNIKDGQFESAEADTDFNGTPDTKFTNAAEFNNWLNDNRPDFSNALGKTDWQFNLLQF